MAAGDGQRRQPRRNRECTATVMPPLAPKSSPLSLARLLQPDQISSWNEVPPRSLLVGNQTYQPGILSRDGWAVVDDTETPRFTYQPPLWQAELPWYAEPLEGEDRADLYFFGCGIDFKSCPKDFVTLSGPIPLPPLATFGVWWSHYETYSEATIKSDVLEKFLQFDLPLNVLQMDCGWHKNNTNAAGNIINQHCQGYNGYDWNEGLFPDPQDFVAAVKSGSLSGSRPLKLLLNTHNFLGMDQCQAEFAELASRSHLANASGPVPYNVTDLATMSGFFDLALGRNASGEKTRGSRPDYCKIVTLSRFGLAVRLKASPFQGGTMAG